MIAQSNSPLSQPTSPLPNPGQPGMAAALAQKMHPSAAAALRGARMAGGRMMGKK